MKINSYHHHHHHHTEAHIQLMTSGEEGAKKESLDTMVY